MIGSPVYVGGEALLTSKDRHNGKAREQCGPWCHWCQSSFSRSSAAPDASISAASSTSLAKAVRGKLYNDLR